MYKFVIITGIVIMMIQGCLAPEVLEPPKAKIIPHPDTTFNDVRVDNYYWLRERDNPEVREYLEAENAYTEYMMKRTEDLQKTLYEEMVGRIREDDLSVPQREGSYYYYSRTEQGKQYEIHCRKKNTLQAEEEILLDENVLAGGREYFDLGAFEISPDHNLLAYSIDTTGSEMYRVFVKDLNTGKVRDEGIINAYDDLAWAGDNATLFYTVLNASKRPFKVYRHRLGRPAAEDALVYHEPDEKFFVGVKTSKSGAYIFMNLNSQVTSEVHFLDAAHPQNSFQRIAPRRHNVEYYVYHHGDSFYILTNDQAVNFRLMKTPVSDPDMKNWQEVLAHRPDVMLDNVEVFADYLAIFERHRGLPKIHIYSPETGAEDYVDFTEESYTVIPGKNPEYQSSVLRFYYSSMVTPKTVYDYDMSTKVREQKKQQEVLGGFDPDKYVTRRIYARAEDGTRIPISLLHQKDIVLDGNNPLLLYGYGSYGLNSEPYFSSNRFSLVDRGMIWAIAHIRGGGDLGRRWYEEGKLLNKKNTFSDFIACAEHLIDDQYTSPEHLAIMGGSAGGLLIGAVINMRPKLFKAAVAHVPFVDALNTMLDPTIPLTVIEYDEWGNPNYQEYYEYIKSYSPYDNVHSAEYPHLLITAGLNDPRVQYWEPAKWAAKLRAENTGSNRLLLKTDLTSGHGGASGRYNQLQELAFEYAFILDALQVTNQ